MMTVIRRILPESVTRQRRRRRGCANRWVPGAALRGREIRQYRRDHYRGRGIPLTPEENPLRLVARSSANLPLW
ncbi:hypothetical protein KCP73_21765 [Salmonella enterica subsp. enterica]|nr:hypothetical protein KCP73_21765 [Salmonella enterica subsp. enterica]